MSERNLWQRIVAIMADMGAVGKGGKTNFGERYEYHRIDDIDDKLRESLVQHGVVATIADIRDRKLEHFEESDKSGKPRTTWYAECTLDILLVNADKPDEQAVIRGWGQGLDYSDKATGKAISYAAKAAYLSAFHLRGQPDNEAEQIERQPAKHQPPPPTGPPLTDEEIAELNTCITGCSDLAALQDSILKGQQYRRLKSAGPPEAYEKTAKLAKAKHAILSTQEQHNAESGT
jgi:hypothetical protein